MADLKVQEGQTVEAGQLIGTMGATGYAFGVHLHFGVYYGRPHIGTSVNPMQFF